MDLQETMSAIFRAHGGRLENMSNILITIDHPRQLTTLYTFHYLSHNDYDS